MNPFLQKIISYIKSLKKEDFIKDKKPQKPLFVVIGVLVLITLFVSCGSNKKCEEALDRAPDNVVQSIKFYVMASDVCKGIVDLPLEQAINKQKENAPSLQNCSTKSIVKATKNSENYNDEEEGFKRDLMYKSMDMAFNGNAKNSDKEICNKFYTAFTNNYSLF